MGNQRSRQQNPNNANIVEVIPSTPQKASTPNDNFSNDNHSQHVMALIDPRSPTMEISRTPITVEEERARREKLLKMMLKVNNGQDFNITPKMGDEIPPGFDPRSPNCAINRTPILLENIDVEGYNSEDNSSPQWNNDKPGVKRDLDSGVTNSGQLCRDLRKRLFITQRLNMSDNELLSTSTNENDEENKEN